MNFLTQEEIKEASKDEMTALECSLKHHQQGRDATSLELQVAVEERKFILNAEFCAVCKYQDDCCDCSLYVDNKGETDEKCCNGLFGIARAAANAFYGDPSNANHAAFQLAEGKVCDYIQGVIDKKKKQIADEAKPELRHGDYGRSNSKNMYFIDGRSCNGHACKFYGISDTGGEIDLANPTYGFKSLGNIFDDLKAMQETVTEFKMTESKAATSKYTLEVTGWGSEKFGDVVQIQTTNGKGKILTVNFSQDEFETFTMNCRKKLATLNRNK